MAAVINEGKAEICQRRKLLVDGGVYFTGDATPGEFVDVTLEGATAFDFHGTLVPSRQLLGV